MRKLVFAAGLVAVAVTVVLVLRAAAAGSDGPQPIAWDREPCAHCHMLIGEPAFAAQAALADGQVLDFDDPGCLLAWLAGQAQPPRAVWLHHSREDRWLPAARAGFVAAGRTPMGWGLAVVNAGSPGALSFDEARAKVAR